MSKYTTEVRFICEESAGLAHSDGYSSIDSVLDKARDKIFDFDFPIFDESYRVPLENKILKHYYTREIGFETVGLWKHFLNTRMNEIMPYYNKLYTSELISFNPMYDVDLTTDYNKVHNGNSDKSSEFIEHGSFMQEDTSSQHNNSKSTTNSNENTNLTEATSANGNETHTENKTYNEDTTANESTNYDSSSNSNSNSTSNNDRNSETSGGNKNDHWEYFSDTPEGGIQGLTASGAVGDLNYLTTATHITDDGTGSHTSVNENNSTETNSDSSKTENGVGNKDANGNKNGTEDIGATIDKITNSATSTTGDKRGSQTINTDGDINSNALKAGNDDKNGSTNSNEIINNTEDYLHHVIGKTGGVSYSKLLNEYRDTFLNIDMLIIKELKDLFMNVW